MCLAHCASRTFLSHLSRYDELFLVGAFRRKDPTITVTRFFLQDSLECDEVFVQFVQLNEDMEKASKLLQKVSPFIYSF